MFEASLLSREHPLREVSQLFDLSDVNESRCSSLLKLLRVTAWIYKFVNILNKRESCFDPLHDCHEIAESKVVMRSLHPVKELFRYSLWK